MTANNPRHPPALCIDLDGTLITTDLLFESLVQLLKNQCWLIFVLPFKLLQGKAAFKAYVCSKTCINPKNLPYNPAILDWLNVEKSKRDIYLITAAPQAIADAIANHLGCFKQAYGSSSTHNLSGHNKSKFLCDTFGEKAFDYAGNAKIDIPVWNNANHCFIANNTPRLTSSTAHLKNTTIINQRPSIFKACIKAMRPHQYTKNLLILIPFILGMHFSQLSTTLQIFGAFIAYSLLASSVYLLNDLCDIDADRNHRSKCKRPFANGSLPIPTGTVLMLTLLALSMLSAWALSSTFFILCIAYYLLNLVYSFQLKKMLLLDVIILSVLFTSRIVAGMIITPNGYSPWLLVFSLFFFTGLAFLKRYTELSNHPASTGRAYQHEHMLSIQILGITCSIASLVVFSFYIHSTQAARLYLTPSFLYLLIPALLYWVARIWLLASENKVHDDPIIFAIKDKATYFVGAYMILTLLIAKLIHVI